MKNTGRARKGLTRELTKSTLNRRIYSLSQKNHQATEAQRHGFTLMTGCMICSSLSIAPIMLIAEQAEFVDLDGPLWLKSDRPLGVTSENDMLCPAQPGFWGGL